MYPNFSQNNPQFMSPGSQGNVPMNPVVQLFGNVQIEKIKMVEKDGEYMDSFEEGQSGRYYPNRSYGIDGRQHWDDPRMYDGLSGRRMRSSTTGRYMSGNNTRSYGMPDPGYSGHSIKDRMVAKLEEMYDEAKTEHERQIVDEWINRLEDR